MQTKYKKALFVAEDEGPRAFYRAKVPAYGLRKNGWMARNTSIIYEQENHQWNGWSQGQTDIVPAPRFIVSYGWLKPEHDFKPNEEVNFVFSSDVKVIESIRECGQYFFFDLDSDEWNLPEGAPYSPIKKNWDIWMENVNASNGLIVSTPSIYQSAQKSDIKVPIYVVPNSINYYDLNTHPEHDPLRIGWFGDLKLRINDLNVIKDDLYKSLRGMRDKVEFWHVGATFAVDSSIRRILPKFPVDIIERPWYRTEYLYEILQEIDIGIIPAEQTIYNNGRSNILGLAFAASGIPFVASPIKEYQTLAYSTGYEAILPSSYRGRSFTDQLLYAIETPEYRQQFKHDMPRMMVNMYPPQWMGANYENVFTKTIEQG